MKRGDIVVLVAAGALGKPRPGVIVQSDELGDDTNTIIVCPMSSELGGAVRLRPIVEPSAENGVRVRSQIMTDKMIALSRQRVRRVIGRLEPDAQHALDQSLMIALGLIP